MKFVYTVKYYYPFLNIFFELVIVGIRSYMLEIYVQHILFTVVLYMSLNILLNYILVLKYSRDLELGFVKYENMNFILYLQCYL